jgi:hypothetical protein
MNRKYKSWRTLSVIEFKNDEEKFIFDIRLYLSAFEEVSDEHENFKHVSDEIEVMGGEEFG